MPHVETDAELRVYLETLGGAQPEEIPDELKAADGFGMTQAFDQYLTEAVSGFHVGKFT